MITPGYLPLKGDRFTAFAATLTFNNIDISSRALKAQIRVAPNVVGTPLVELLDITDPLSTGLIRQGVTFNNGVAKSLLRLFITETTIKGMAAASGLTGSALTDPQDLVFAWDLTLGDDLGVPQVALSGPFILRGGVTHV